MCSIETEDRSTMSETAYKSYITNKYIQQSISVSMINKDSTTKIGEDNIYTILIKLSIGILMRTINLDDNIFFSILSHRITDFYTLFSICIIYNINRTIFRVILNHILDGSI